MTDYGHMLARIDRLVEDCRRMDRQLIEELKQHKRYVTKSKRVVTGLKKKVKESVK